MSSGLIALLDDVAALAKAAAASIDDIATQAAKAGTKAAGVVIDDTAVTPRYVAGLAPSRELPIVGRIALGSLRNKVLFLMPAALALGLLAPWAITPLLMLGGLFLCFEGAEKVIEALVPHSHGPAEEDGFATPSALEEAKVAGAIRTDFILSAEIMAITLASVPDAGFATQAAVLAVVGVGITLGVYGAVALIVKLDDIGLALAATRNGLAQRLGGLLVRGMAPLLRALGIAGTAAMLWVGGGIILHGLEVLGLDGPAHAVVAAGDALRDAMPWLGGTMGWATESTLAAVLGMALGTVVVAIHARVLQPAWRLIGR